MLSQYPNLMKAKLFPYMINIDQIKKIREDYESRHKKQIEKLQSEFTNFGIENDYHRRHLNSCKCFCHALG